MPALSRTFVIAISVLCHVACSTPASLGDERCVPRTYHACNCDDGRTGIRLCSATGTSTGSCDCDSDPAKLPMTATGKPGQVAVPTQTGVGNTPATGPISGGSAGRGAAAPVTPSNNNASGMNTAAAGSGNTGSGNTDSGNTDSTPATGPLSIVVDPTDEAAYIFDQQEVRTYNIIVAQADLTRINASPAAEQLVPAMLEFEGQTYGPYSVRYKGSQGSFTYPCTMSNASSPKAGKCSMKLDFNETDPEARFYGLKKLNFHSMNADSSMLRDRLGYQLFREMGVAAPRAVHARVMVNGELEGLFIAVEQIDSRFSRAHFSDGGKGNVYKEVWPMHDDLAPYMDALETNKDDMPSVQGLLDFKFAIDQSRAAAERYFDRDYMMRFLAVDRVIINDDGAMHFWCNEVSGQGSNPGAFGNHNYYWYEETASPHYWLIPWDLDHSFDNYPAVRLDLEWTQTAACTCRNQSVAGMDRPASCDPLVQHFISWLPDYEAQVDQFLAGPLRKQHVDSMLRGWSDQIRSAVAESAGVNLAPDDAAWTDAVNELISKVDSARTNRGYAY